jgi:alpha 1,3-glucosidase
LRPIWFDQEKVVDEANMDEQERFLVGDGLLVVPILERGVNTVKGALKGLEGRWYDYYSKREMLGDEEISTGLERIGCFVKGGHIIPTFDVKSYTKSSKDAKESNIQLYVAADEEDKAQGKLYFDDGESFDYKKGACARKSISFDNNTLTWEAVDAENCNFAVQNRVTKVTLAGVTGKFQKAFLVEEGKAKQKVQVTKGSNHTTVEFVALANKNWKIVLE